MLTDVLALEFHADPTYLFARIDSAVTLSRLRHARIPFTLSTPGDMAPPGKQTPVTSWLALGVSVSCNPILHRGRMIVATIDGAIHALDHTAARQLWSAKVKGTSVRGVAAADDLIVATIQWGGVSAGRGIVVAVEADSGRVVWQERADAAIGTAPCVVGPAVVYGTQETGLKPKSGMLTARDVATGALLWTRQAQAFEHELTVVDGALIGVAGEGALYCVDLESGSTRWRVGTERFFAAGPTIADRIVYIGGQDGTVYAIGLDDGEERWRFRRRHAFARTPFVAHGLVHVGSWDESQYALDARTGGLVWRRPLRAMATSTPTGFGARVCVGCSDQTVHAFDAHTGERAWRWKGPHESWNSGISARPILDADKLFVFAMSGELYVLDTATGRAVARPHGALAPVPEPAPTRSERAAERSATEEEVGYIAVPSGRVVACDPIVEPVTTPLDRTVPKGLLRVVAGVETSADERVVTFLELRFRDVEVMRWQPPRRGVRKVGVDSACAALMSVEAARVLVADPEAVDCLAPLFDRQTENSAELPQPWALVSFTDGAAPDAVVCSSGYGDGEYAVLYGLDAANRLARIRICFIPPDGVEA